MTPERDFDRIARDWLGRGPNEAPDRVIAAVLTAVKATPQVRPWARGGLPWAGQLPKRGLSVTAVVLIIALVAGTSLWLNGSRNAAIGPASTASPSPSVTVTSTPSATPSAPQASPSPVSTGGSPAPSVSPSVVLKPIRDALAIADGVDFTCALIRGGTVKCWGINDAGQLGSGSTGRCTWSGNNVLCSTTPVTVPNLSGIVAISLGGYHACVLTAQGGVKCWGQNDVGQLGDGSTTNSSVPVDVVGLTSGVTAIAGGYLHTCALTTTGGVKCWGANTDGGLGDGSTTNSSVPVDVSGLARGVTAVSANGGGACAIVSGGGLKCWGGGYGTLLTGATADSLVPVAIPGLAGGVIAISVGGSHACAVLTSGSVRCWGLNQVGELGNGLTKASGVPVTVIGLGGVVAIASSGDYHTCALTSGGAVTCWGYNFWGQLGDGTTNDSRVPVAVSGLTSGAVAITAHGYQHSCAVLATGGVRCWGGNEAGELGDGTTRDSTTPVVVSAP